MSVLRECGADEINGVASPVVATPLGAEHKENVTGSLKPDGTAVQKNVDHCRGCDDLEARKWSLHISMIFCCLFLSLTALRIALVFVLFFLIYSTPPRVNEEFARRGLTWMRTFQTVLSFVARLRAQGPASTPTPKTTATIRSEVVDPT